MSRSTTGASTPVLLVCGSSVPVLARRFTDHVLGRGCHPWEPLQRGFNLRASFIVGMTFRRTRHGDGSASSQRRTRSPLATEPARASALASHSTVTVPPVWR